LPGWTFDPEVSFSYFGERGVIDVLGWHAEAATMLVIELKTEIVDVQELMGTMDRRVRLAPRIANDRGHRARNVAAWVILANDRSNHCRLHDHRGRAPQQVPCRRTQHGELADASFPTDLGVDLHAKCCDGWP